MKHVQKKLAIICLSLIVSTNVHAWGSKRPSTPTQPTVPVVPPAPPVVTPTPPPTGPYLDQIKELAGSSTCAAYSWKNRSRAPAGYIKGMAISFARGVCRLRAAEETSSLLVDILAAPRASTATKDALTHYQTKIASLAIQTSTRGIEPLRATYVLGIGLGMRESSGKYCEGRDMSASNTSASTAEAGVFQTSYDSVGASPELSKLFAEYKADNSKCFLDVFKQGVSSCGNSSIAGSGIGAEFQALNKSCPAFATEYAMVMLRVRHNHYGPINRKEAEVIPACNQMLKSVQALIESDPYSCEDIF
jgi:hypothetical protein